MSKVDRYQPLLDAVKSKESPHRVVFAPLGTAENGFTNAVIRMIAPAQTMQNALGATVQRKAYTTTLYSRPGEVSFFNIVVVWCGVVWYGDLFLCGI